MRPFRRGRALVVLAALSTAPLISTVGASVAFADIETPDELHVEVGWQPPVGLPVTIGERFDPPAVRWGSGHRGVDLCPPVGSPVYAPKEGSVVYAGKFADRNVVSIRHSSGVRSTFEPVTPTVQVGAHVFAGALLGTLDEGHTNNCLHWGLKVNRDVYLNPLGALIGKPVLKPIND